MPQQDSIELQNENPVMCDDDTGFQYLNVEYFANYVGDLQTNDNVTGDEVI